MNFKEWLNENNNTVQFGMWSKDGTVVFYINGKRYSYLTDSFYHTKWKNMIYNCPAVAQQRNSWRVVKDIEKTGTRLD